MSTGTLRSGTPSTAALALAPAARRAAFLTVLLGATMIGLGFLLTKRLDADWPLTVEDGVDRTLATHRTRLLDDVSWGFSTGASTYWTIGIAAILVLVVRRRLGRWREALFVASALVIEATVFLVTVLVVARQRPAVHELDKAPATSSFPSGHTAAAVALYGALFVLAWRRGSGWPDWLLLLVPVAVGASRLYRGMHHPSDVAASLLLGIAAILISQHAVLGQAVPRRPG